MERNAKYVIVGLFVTAVTVAAIGFLVWLVGSDTGPGGNRYALRFTAVDGLTEGASVKFRGVDVGQVLDIRFVADADRPIEVIAGLEDGFELNRNTTATLGMQGITGIAYVDLGGAAGGSPAIEVQNSDGYPVIGGTESGFSALADSLPEWSDGVTRLLERLDALLAEENLGRFERSLKSIEQLTATAADHRADLARLLENSVVLTENAGSLVDELDGFVTDLRPEARIALGNVAEASSSMRDVATRIEDLLRKNERRLDTLMGEGSEELVALSRESREAARQISSLARELRQNPSRLIFEPPDDGVVLQP